MASSSAPTESEKIVLPLRPAPTYKDDPRATLSESEQKMYDQVLSHFTKTDPEYTLPEVEKGELTEQEEFWLSRECLLRYLRACKWKVSTAIQRLEATLKWRREFGLYDVVSAEHVEPEAVTGKEILFGYDVGGKPAFYMIPSRQNTTEATGQIQFAVWMLERGVDLMEPGVETLALLINFGDRGKNPSVSTALAILNILQNHYPERLGLALIINVPFLVNAFFKMVMPLVDPITRAKVKFNPEIINDGLFTSDMVMKDWWGGDCDFEYKHEHYWKDLVNLCKTRSQTWLNSWRELGAKIGESEWAYKKGGAAVDITSETVPSNDERNEQSAAGGIPVATVDVLEKQTEVDNVHVSAADTSSSAHAEDTAGHTANSTAVGAGTVATGASGEAGDGAVVDPGATAGGDAGGE